MNNPTFVAQNPHQGVLRSPMMPTSEFTEVHRLIDRRTLLGTSVAHYTALNPTPDQLSELAARQRHRSRPDACR
jgi:DNA-binding FadR family transcriptional regulator